MKSKKTAHQIFPALLSLIAVAALLFLGSCEGTTSGTETGNQISLQGRVLDKDNAPVAGVTVRLAKTGLGDTTDFQGRYHILKDTAIQAQPGVLDTLVFLQDSQRVAELEVTKWVEVFSDVKLVQRNVTGRFTIADPGIGKVEAVLSGTGIPQSRPAIAEFFYNKPMNEYSGFLYFPPGGGMSAYAVYINVYDTSGFLIGRSDTISFNGLAGDITIPNFDPGNLTRSGWIPQASGTTEILISSHFADSNTGWVAGDAQTILKTTDGGVNWISQKTGASGAWIQKVQFIGADTGWALELRATSANTLHKTVNGGALWTPQIISQATGLVSFHFADVDTGWIVGLNGAILKTTDGGTTWTAQNSGTSIEFLSAYFVDAQTGWAVGGRGIIVKTTDGGTNWLMQDSVVYNLYSVYFINANIGWAAGGGIYRTTDGGTTWIRESSGTIWDLRSVRFINPNTGWAVGFNGIILATTDGGNTWRNQKCGTPRGLSSINLIDANIGFIVGEGGTILKTTVGGKYIPIAPQ